MAILLNLVKSTVETLLVMLQVRFQNIANCWEHGSLVERMGCQSRYPANNTSKLGNSFANLVLSFGKDAKSNGPFYLV